MKEFSIILACIIVTLAACGGGGSLQPSAAQEAVDNSLVGFVALQAALGETFQGGGCTPKVIQECPCPSSGVADIDDTTFDSTLASCTTSDALVYTGTITPMDDTDTEYDMLQFGECTNLTGTLTDTGTGGDSNCTGTLSATCAGEYVSCSISTDCTSCTIQ